MLSVVGVLFLVFVTVEGEIMAGGITDVEETADIRNAAHFAANTINADVREIGSRWHTLTKINSPSQQVVNGMMYRMEIILKESDCWNVEGNNSSGVMDCPPVIGGVTKRCLVKVWHQHYRKPEYTLENDVCMEE